MLRKYYWNVKVMRKYKIHSDFDPLGLAQAYQLKQR